MAMTSPPFGAQPQSQHVAARQARLGSALRPVVDAKAGRAVGAGARFESGDVVVVHALAPAHERMVPLPSQFSVANAYLLARQRVGYAVDAVHRFQGAQGLLQLRGQDQGGAGGVVVEGVVHPLVVPATELQDAEGQKADDERQRQAHGHAPRDPIRCPGAR